MFSRASILLEEQLVDAKFEVYQNLSALEALQYPPLEMVKN